jgi:hypothetical protein
MAMIKVNASRLIVIALAAVIVANSSIIALPLTRGAFSIPLLYDIFYRIVSYDPVFSYTNPGDLWQYLAEPLLHL